MQTTRNAKRNGQGTAGTGGRAARLAGLALAVLAACVALAWPLTASADIYAFVDRNGTKHFSNQPNDPRYRLYLKEPTGDTPKPSYVLGRTRNPGDYRLRNLEARLDDPYNNPLLRGRPYQIHVQRAARENEVDPALVHAVIAAESNYNPKAVSEKGAIGLMQIMPDTGRRFGAKAKDLYSPAENIEVGVRYLAELIEMFNGNIELALASYNAGEQAVIRFGNRVPPYPETRAYVPRVLRYYHQLKAYGQS
jgi:soluble lytic murein transglycosylase-like protein